MFEHSQPIPLENDNNPRVLPYYTTTVRYSALGIVKLPVKFSQPPHQPPSNDLLFEFLIDLGYKGQLKHISEMYVDHMHQPWRTLRAIINRCLSGKTSSNDRLRPSRIEMIWGLYHNENLDYAALIWEDLEYQIDNKDSKVRRRSRIYKTTDDGVLGRLKFISKGEDHQVHGKHIPYTFVTEAIKDSKAYKMFIGHSTSLIPPKKGRCKTGQGKKEIVTPVKKTRLKRSSKKKTSKKESPITADDNIIPDPDQPLKLAVSMSKTDAEIAEETRRVHETYEHIDTSDKMIRRPTTSLLTKMIGDLNQEATMMMIIFVSPSDKRKGEEEIEWVYTDDEEADELFDDEVKNDDDDEDDKSIDIETSDDERIESDTNDNEMGDATKTDADTLVKEHVDEEEKDNAKKVEEKKANEDLKGDEQVQYDQTRFEQVNKENPNLQFSTSNHSVSSNFVSVVPDPSQIPPSAPPTPTPKTPTPEPQNPPVPESEALAAALQRISNLENDIIALKQVDHSKLIYESIRTQMPIAVSTYLGSSLDHSFLNDEADEEEHKQKDILFQMMMKSKSYNKHPTHKDLYKSLVQSIFMDEDDMDKTAVDPTAQRKRRHDDEGQDPAPDSDKPKKRPRTKYAKPSKKYSIVKASTKDDITPKIPKKYWFKQPPRPETPDWNTFKVDETTPEQTWFNEIVQAEKAPLTFDELMSTPIDFTSFAKNHLQLDTITREVLRGPIFNLLKKSCKTCVELEYNMEECYRALSDKLDWTNPKGYQRPIDMRNPLPLQEKEGRLIIPVEFFFNNNVKYLEAGNSERKYSSSITKTPAARHTLEGIEDKIPKLWSPIKVVYDKNDAYGIAH
ncbi:hypothetical protein Tco_0134535 [Tanacetum coccineum]